MTGSDEYAEKNSFTVMVPEELVRDSQVNLLEFLRNPAAFKREPVSLTRRQRIRNFIQDFRLRFAEFLYKVVAGCEFPEERLWYDE